MFGEAQFVAQLAIIVKTEGRQYGCFAKTHEYLLVYARSILCVKTNEVKDVNGCFRYSDEKGGFNTIGLRNRAVRIFNSSNRPNLRYPIYVDVDNPSADGLYSVSTKSNKGWIEVWPSIVDGLESVWRWGKETAEKNKDELLAIKGIDGEFRIFKKDRSLTVMAKRVWFEKEMNSIYGTREVASFLGKGFFDFPKPLALLRKVTEVGSDKDSLILDFFSGSATMAHAVMQLNAEDGGNRKFILVQLPEVCVEGSEAAKAGYKNICEIGKERIRRAGKKIKEENATTAQNLDVGFRVFKIDSSNMDDIYFQPLEVQQQDMIRMINNVKTDRTALDLLFGCLLEWGLPIDLPITKRTDLGNDTYDVDGGRIIASFDSNVGDAAVKAIANEKPDFAIFRDLSFNNSAAKINVGEIFKAISPNTQVKVL